MSIRIFLTEVLQGNHVVSCDVMRECPRKIDFQRQGSNCSLPFLDALAVVAKECQIFPANTKEEALHKLRGTEDKVKYVHHSLCSPTKFGLYVRVEALASDGPKIFFGKIIMNPLQLGNAIDRAKKLRCPETATNTRQLRARSFATA